MATTIASRITSTGTQLVNGSFDEASLPAGAISFNGTSQYLSTPVTIPINTLFDLVATDFTIEGWAYINNTTGAKVIFDQRPASTQGIYPTLLFSGATLLWYVNSATQITSSSLSATTWYHFAICRSGTSTKMFINGTQSGSTYTDSNNYLASRTYVGASAFDQTDNFNGYLDDVRITKGFARYTANFTAPTAAFPLQ